MTEQQEIDQKLVKIPKDYDFSNKHFDEQSYQKDFILRTDAVWEKSKLKDWFRLYHKVFFFNHTLRDYQLMEPEDLYTVVFEPWALEDLEPFVGYTPTGRTNAFQHGMGPKQKVAYSHNTNQTKQDYFDLCALRFERWFRCDSSFYKIRAAEFDYVKDHKQYKTYPCYKEFYETSYACQDDQFDFLMELAYAKRASNFSHEKTSNLELRTFPTVFDTPNKAERRTYTY